MKTLSQVVSSLKPNTIISVSNSYGIIWTGKAKFVFGHFTFKAMQSQATISGNLVTII